MSSQLIAKFVLHLETQGRSPSTLVAYRKDLEQLHQHLNTDLLTLKSEQVREALSALTRVENFTPKTVSRKINSYRTFFRFAVDSGLLAQNPALEVSHPRFKPKQPRVL